MGPGTGEGEGDGGDAVGAGAGNGAGGSADTKVSFHDVVTPASPPTASCVLTPRALRRVGVHVEEDVFSHGQLYVAFSRCGDPVNLCVFGPPPEADGAVWIKNVVYKEVLIEDTSPFTWTMK